MKAAVLKEEKFIIKQIENIKLEQNQKGAIIRVLGCGLCGSDIVKLKTGKAKDDAILGHEVVGKIIDINSSTNFRNGDRIALGHHIPCFNCKYCRDEHYSMCQHFKETNIIPGGFSEYIFVSEEHLLNTTFKVNDDLSDIKASFLEPLGCCIRAVKRARITDESNCLVIGLGTIGILMGQAIEAFGNRAYGCDLIEERVKLSEEYGFEKSFNTTDETKAIKEMEKIAPFDRIFLTAGASKALDTALKLIRDGGSIIVFSSIKNNNGFENNDIYYKELTIMGSYSSSPADLKDSMELISSGKVLVDGLSDTYPLEKLNEAIDDTVNNKIMKAYIKL